MLRTADVAHVATAGGLGLISGGIWLMHGQGAGLIALGVGLLLVAAADYDDE